MAIRLVAHCASHVRQARLTVRAIRAFRQAQEHMRDAANIQPERLDQAQLELAAEKCKLPLETVRSVVRDWMFERPLALLSRCADPSLQSVLAGLRRRGLRLGVYSDYPAEEKLMAMDVRDHFDVVVSSYDSEVSCFKPNKKGFEFAMAKLDACATSAIYVGDRDIDGVGAAAAGMKAILVQPHAGRTETSRFPTIRNLRELAYPDA